MDDKQEELRRYINMKRRESEHRECSFRPNILQESEGGLSARTRSVQGGNTNLISRLRDIDKRVEERLLQWNQNKQINRIKLEAELKNYREKECTFKPRLQPSKSNSNIEDVTPRDLFVSPDKQKKAIEEFEARNQSWLEV